MNIFKLAKTLLDVAQLGICSHISQMGGWLKFDNEILHRDGLTDSEQKELIDASARAVERYGQHFNLHLTRFVLSV